MKRIGAALVLVLSLLVAQPAEATPPDFAITDCPGMSDSVLRLYTAGLGRTADEGGYDFWFEQYQAGNWSLQRAAEHFVVSEEFVASYGLLNNLDFVEQLYRNVLGRAGEPDGIEFWTGQLDTDARSRATVLLNFAESPENVELSGTTPPSLGSFNGGLEGPWTCTQQPANGTCQVGTYITGNPQWDITIEIPESISETAVVATFEVLRDGVVIHELPMEFEAVSKGQRLRGLSSISSAPLNPLEDVPIDELTCRVLRIEGRASLQDVVEGGVKGDLDTAECKTELGEADVQVGEITFGRFVIADVTAVNTTGLTAYGRAVVVFLVDGFRIAEGSASFGDVTPGATANDSAWLHSDVVPVGIDSRRVTCEVSDLFWVAN